MSDLTLALRALDALTQQLAPKTLDRTAHCALVVRASCTHTLSTLALQVNRNTAERA